jgi:hypothetical protein
VVVVLGFHLLSRALDSLDGLLLGGFYCPAKRHHLLLENLDLIAVLLGLEYIMFLLFLVLIS